MKRIHESIIILSLLDEDLRNRDETIIFYKLHFAQFETDTRAEQHYMSLFNMSLINIKSYLDEYDNYFGGTGTENIYFERVNNLKKCLEPLLSYLRKWKGISDFRNNYLAHTMRDSKTKNIILLETSFEHYHIPNDFAWKHLLNITIYQMISLNYTC